MNIFEKEKIIDFGKKFLQNLISEISKNDDVIKNNNDHDNDNDNNIVIRKKGGCGCGGARKNIYEKKTEDLKKNLFKD
jgi:hypothetical protein